MELKKIDSALQELSFAQSIDINGGESAWYWICYGVGTAISCIATFATEGGRNAGICVR